jgi:hypothetical protein
VGLNGIVVDGKKKARVQTVDGLGPILQRDFGPRRIDEDRLDAPVLRKLRHDGFRHGAVEEVLPDPARALRPLVLEVVADVDGDEKTSRSGPGW